MSVHQVQQCLFDHLRRLERLAPGSEPVPVSVEGYDLTDPEREALRGGDVAALYSMGTHPVLINGFCRSQGWKRADYRVLFEGSAAPHGGFEGRPRWRSS